MDASVCPNYFSTKIRHNHQCIRVFFCPQFPHMLCPKEADEKEESEKSQVCQFPHFEKAQIKKMTCSFFYSGIKRNLQTAVFLCTCIFFKQVYSQNFRSQRPDVSDNRNSHMYLRGRMKKEKGGALPTERTFT